MDDYDFRKIDKEMDKKMEENAICDMCEKEIQINNEKKWEGMIVCKQCKTEDIIKCFDEEFERIMALG